MRRVTPSRDDDAIRERPWTDLGNAEMFAELFQDDARFNHKTGRWIVWQDRRWKNDGNGYIMGMAKMVPRLRYRKSSEIADDDKRKKAAQFARECESLSSLRSLVELAKTEKPLSNDGTGWDTDPFLLGVANGVLDLKSAMLRPDRHEDYVTIHSPIEFDTDSQCPRWEQFLREVFNNDGELIDYIQRAVGYSLTGLVTEQVFHILFGEGQNGKSVFLNILSHVFGPYSYTLPFSAFEKSQRSAISNELAESVGKRLITVSEVEETKTLNEARLKSMTGGDRQSARFLYGNQFNFKPTAKLWFSVNRKPLVADDSHAIWRRLRLVPFINKFEQADRNLEEKLRAEAPGILLWAVLGCLLWQSESLAETPKAISQSSASYRADSDVIGQFLSQECILGKENTVLVVEMYRDFEKWRDENNFPLVTRQKFNASLESRGLARKLHGENRLSTWIGIKKREK